MFQIIKTQIWHFAMNQGNNRRLEFRLGFQLDCPLFNWLEHIKSQIKSKFDIFFKYKKIITWGNVSKSIHQELKKWEAIRIRTRLSTRLFQLHVPLLVTLGHDYCRFNRYIEGLVKFKVCGILQLSRINTSKFGENPCTNKVLNGEQFKFSPTLFVDYYSDSDYHF